METWTPPLLCTRQWEKFGDGFVLVCNRARREGRPPLTLQTAFQTAFVPFLRHRHVLLFVNLGTSHISLGDLSLLELLWTCFAGYRLCSRRVVSTFGVVLREILSHGISSASRICRRSSEVRLLSHGRIRSLCRKFTAAYNLYDL